MTFDMAANLLLVAVALGAVYVVMALGLTFVYGITRVFHFAFGSFYTWAGYIIWTLHSGSFQLDYGLAIAITMPVMFGIGLVYERAIIYPLRRFAEWQWTAIIVTLGSALVLDNLALGIYGPLVKTLPRVVGGAFSYGNILITNHNAATLAVGVATFIILTLFLSKTKTGLAMQGVAQDTIGANIVGLPTNRIYGYAFAITGLLAGISAVLLIPRTQITPFVGWPIFLRAFVVVVFGGLGSIKGTLIAGFILAIIETFVSYYLGARFVSLIFLGVLVILLTFRRRGLFGVW